MTTWLGSNTSAMTWIFIKRMFLRLNQRETLSGITLCLCWGLCLSWRPRYPVQRSHSDPILRPSWPTLLTSIYCARSTKRTILTMYICNVQAYSLLLPGTRNLTDTTTRWLVIVARCEHEIVLLRNRVVGHKLPSHCAFPYCSVVRDCAAKS